MIRAIRDTLDRREDGRSWAVFRVGLALVALLDVAWVAFVPERWPLWLDRAGGGWLATAGSPLFRWVGASVESVGAVSIVTMSLLVAVAVGRGGRVVALAALLGFVSLIDIHPAAGGGYDELLSNGLFLIFAGGTGAYSLDHVRRTGTWSGDVPMWPRILVAYQICLVYATTGWQKISLHWVPWGDRTAIADILMTPSYSRVDPLWVAYLAPLWGVLTAVVWIWEWLAPLWFLAWFRSLQAPTLWWTKVRHAMWAFGVGFHLASGALLELGAFAPASLVFLFAMMHPRAWGAGRQLNSAQPAMAVTTNPMAAGTP